MKRLNQSGSFIVVVAVLVAVIGIAGFVGYRVMNKSSLANKTETAKTTTAAAVAVPSKVESKADVQQANKSLDEMKTSLDSDLDTSALSADLNSL